VSFKKYLPPDLDLSLPEHQPVEGDVEEDLIMTTEGVSSKGISVAPNFGIAGAAQVSLKLQLQFPEGKRGASLVMHKPRQTFISPNTVLEPLFKIEVLRDKYLVTRTFSCPAYSQYLSNGKGEQLSLALAVSTPIPVAPGLTAGGEVSADWKTNIQSQYHRKASTQSGKYSFTPLYDMKKKATFWQRMWRGAPSVPAPEGDDLWEDAGLPWNDDDDDEEELEELDDEEEEKE